MRIGLQTDIPPCLPMAAGRYYFVPNSTSTSTSNALGNTVLRVMPCFIPQGVAVTRIGAEVQATGEAGSKVRLGIYATDPATMRPGALIVDAGQINGDSATVQELTVTGVTLTPGWYWFAQVIQSAPSSVPTMRTSASGSVVPPIDILTTIPSANAAVFGYAMTPVTGALPATFAATGISGSGIRIFIKT